MKADLTQDLKHPKIRHMPAEQLPSFAQPPVVETVLGVQFRPLSSFSSAYLGAFWERLGPDWHEPQDLAPLPQVSEPFDDQLWVPPGIRLGVVSVPESRLRIVHRQHDHMLQLQNGWFVFNWRKTARSPDYPRYSEVRSRFDQYWQGFQQFVAERGLGELEPRLWEVTYVNHIERGSLWQAPRDWARLLPALLGDAPNVGDLAFEDVSGEWAFVIGAEEGRLRIRLAHGRKQNPDPGSNTEAEVLLLHLTARGLISADIDSRDIDRGLNRGRTAIVQAFAAITSEEAHRAWGRNK